MALITDELDAAHSRMFDWKEIRKIAYYIKVLISEGTNAVRADAFGNCESSDLNTLASILTGFNETSYSSITFPEVSGNVSCWDLEVPPLIDLKECDMSTVEQLPCTETWMQRYEGLESPPHCHTCAALPRAHAVRLTPSQGCHCWWQGLGIVACTLRSTSQGCYCW